MSPDPFALAALLISIVSLGFSIEARVRDRHSLRCIAHLSTTYGPAQETYEIEVEVTNFGRRPVSVIEVQYKDNDIDLDGEQPAIWSPIYGGIIDNGIPIELTENQTKSFATGELTRAELLRRTKRIDVVVRDSRGKVYVQTIDNDAHNGAEIEPEAAKLAQQEET